MEEFHGESQQFSNEEESLQSIVKRLGNPVSPVLLGSDCRIFRTSQVDGIIGYHLIRNCAVVMGDPISLPQHQIPLSKAFQSFCTKNDWKTVFFLTSSTFAHWAISNGYKTLIQCSDEAVLNPKLFELKQKLRWKFQHSKHLGIYVKEYEGGDSSLEEQINVTIEYWLKTKKGSQIYMGNIFSLENKRVFYAEKEGKIVGVATLARIDQYQGWVITSFFSIIEAPASVTENLICTIIEILAKEDCKFLCLGIVPKAAVGEIVGITPFSKFFLNGIYKIAQWLFHLDSKMNYFHKYRPDLCPMYMLFSDNVHLNELLALKKILNVKL